jgi:hypothetical protein
VFLGASTEATEVYTSEVTSPTLVVWGTSEPTGVEVLLPREGCVLRFAKVVLGIVRDVMSARYDVHNSVASVEA